PVADLADLTREHRDGPPRLTAPAVQAVPYRSVVVATTTAAVAPVVVELLLHVHHRLSRFAADEDHDVVVGVALDLQVHLGRGAAHHVVHPVARVGTPRLLVRRAAVAPHHQL